MIKAINHITLAVREIERSFAFYHEVMELKPIVKWDKGAYFLVGKQDESLPGSGLWFCLNVDEKRIPTTCYTHYAFSVANADFDQIANKIIQSGYHIFKDNISPGKSLYFLDPDDHKLELHVGTLQTRITSKKMNAGNWKKVEWFI